MSRMKIAMSSCMPGCVFEHCGKVPESVYCTDVFNSPLEEAVSRNDITTFRQLVQEGKTVSVKLKVGQMSCIEFAAMMGYSEVLQALLEDSVNATMLKKYFSLDDVVERAYLISKNKAVFFEREALAEANRYEAALYTAVEYNQPQCVEVMLAHLGNKGLGKHTFSTSEDTLESLSAPELAQIRGHMECYKLLTLRQEHIN